MWGRDVRIVGRYASDRAAARARSSSRTTCGQMTMRSFVMGCVYVRR
jgi:hypothetical protein